ncbi:hypothetical protein L6164_015201 [Bauhinia variegata]|uniref:Uncharacterized protein n=1 Tax=Bauhinia variegata TaxID=167791 RepID=A0ACB9NLW8_BAUVA|nr:hypothetical protein L6164_015201 [Bauhinia variegata]
MSCSMNWCAVFPGRLASIECAHVRNVDYYSKKKHILVTAEHESGVHIWDLRKAKVPIQELLGLTHWVKRT